MVGGTKLSQQYYPEKIEKHSAQNLNASTLNSSDSQKIVISLLCCLLLSKDREIYAAPIV